MKSTCHLMAGTPDVCEHVKRSALSQPCRLLTANCKMVENLQLHSCAPLFVVNSLLGDLSLQVVSTSPKRRSGQIHVAVVTTGVGALRAPVEFNSTSFQFIYRKQGSCIISLSKSP